MSALVINMFGGPGTGKSTLAYKLAGLLKQHNYNAELLVEYVKHSAYTDNRYELHDQVILTAQHNHKMRILQNQVDVIVTDASLLNCLAYSKESEQAERDLCVALYNRYNNIGFMLPRKKNYLKVGRTQSKEEAVELDDKIFNAIEFLPLEERIDLRSIPVDDNGVKLLETVYTIITNKLNRVNNNMES